MAVNLFDSANELEKAVRESTEFSTLKAAFKEVNADPSAKQLFENFRNVQLQLQQKQMMGQDISEQEVQQAQQIVQLAQQNPKISNLMEAEHRMSMIIAELNKIIMKPLEELYGPLG